MCRPIVGSRKSPPPDAVARCWQMPEETGEPLRVGQFRAFVACAFQVYE